VGGSIRYHFLVGGKHASGLSQSCTLGATSSPHLSFTQAAAEPVQHHMAAPEVEERAPHSYEGQGIGRRESLRGEDLPPPRHHDDEPVHK